MTGNKHKNNILLVKTFKSKRRQQSQKFKHLKINLTRFVCLVIKRKKSVSHNDQLESLSGKLESNVKVSVVEVPQIMNVCQLEVWTEVSNFTSCSVCSINLTFI